MDAFITLWSHVGIKDLIDVILVSFLLYQGLLIIQGTRAVQMLTGVGALLALFWVGHSFKLYSLNWILDHFFDSFFIIAIILFQDQFRAALANFGRHRNVFGLAKKTIDSLDVDEVVEACAVMGRERIGALIVLERSQGLSNVTETGTLLGAEIHSDLIYSIFQSRSPLHDGAMVINDGKIVAAGCFLPLSKNVEIDRHMGTRHRAALGSSEQSDAVVIIVSEETGRINLCEEGRFYFCENPRQLRQYLKHLLAGERLDEALVITQGLGHE